jgi:hypothetical protein
MVALLLQPFVVPVTVYVVDDAGVATTVAPLPVFRLPAGDQLYAAAPLAVSVALCVMQMITGGVTFRTGKGFTLTCTVVDAVHPRLLPVTVYWVDKAGVAFTLLPLPALSPVSGDQE